MARLFHQSLSPTDLGRVDEEMASPERRPLQWRPTCFPIGILNSLTPRGRALDWFEIIGYALVQVTATDFAQLKEALTENVLAVRNKTDLEVRF
ncbi:hypothetical protein TNCV_1394781 [Trichonephila clavipes]|nr:hypothetical protein TNCV_1394781 [Trichonephila clavipes]